MMGTILKLDNDVRTDSLGQPLREGDRLVYSYYSPSGGDQQDHGLRPVRPADPRGAGVLRSRRSTVRTFATGCRRSVKSRERGEASQNSVVRHPDMPAFDPAVKGWTMAGDAEKVVSQKFCPRFGMLAVEMGYVSVEQVREAMAQQIDDDFANRPHRLLGTILVDKGWMTFREVEMVLEKLFTLQQR
jgi:hypothetical protein